MMILDMIFIAALLYAAFTVGYQLLMWYAGGKYHPTAPSQQAKSDLLRFVLVVPAYREDKVILKTAVNLLQQHYPLSHYSIMVVADGLHYDTVKSLYELNIDVVEVHFEKSTKVKALQAAVHSISNCYDYVVLLDADNRLDQQFLSELNHRLIREEHWAVQVSRTTHGEEQGVAFWDAFSEYCNNRLSAEGPSALGLSCKFAGSGMVLNTGVFVNAIMRMDSVSGFDKDMETRLTRQGIFIHYFGDLAVYDEKVSDHRQLAKQRGRWIYAQYEYLIKNIRYIPRAFDTGNLDFLHRVLHLALPPRFMFASVLTLLLPISWVLFPAFFSGVLLVWSLHLYLYLSLLWSFSGGSLSVLKEILSLFQVAKGYLGALYYLPRAAKHFLHTSHQSK